MFYIDSSRVTPNAEYLQERQLDLLSEGIAVNDLNNLLRDYREIYNNLRTHLKKKYGIENPNSSPQVLKYFSNCLFSTAQGIINKLHEEYGVDLSIYCKYLIDTTCMLRGDVVTPEKVEEHVRKSGEEMLIKNMDIVYQFVAELSKNGIIQFMYKGDGEWTTNKDAMSNLALSGYQSAVDIMSYRKAKNFFESVSSFHTAMCGDGRVHPKMSIGKTNRLEYKEPALMNIPKQLLWEIVGPRTEGNMLVSIDIKNQEPLIMINMLGIERLRAFAEEGDIYESVFIDIFGREPAPIERKELKIAWNAMSYGATKFGVKAMCKNIDGMAVYQYFDKIKEFKEYKAEKGRLAKAKVQTATTYFGTELKANEYNQAKLKRVLMDIPIQGTGSDILALLVENFDYEMERRDLVEEIRLYFTRKDELIVEVDQHFVAEVGKTEVFRILEDVFMHVVDDWTPFLVKIREVGKDIANEDGGLFIDDED